MKIVILQSMYDSLGGIYSVNKELMKMFHEEKYEIYLISVRLSGYYQNVEYPSYINNILINDKLEWGILRYKDIITEIKKLNMLKALKMFIKRINYKISINQDYKITKKAIETINPDFIINSHYELLDAIPNKFLKKTIMHFHTNFNLVKENYSYQKIFNKYKDKIYKFVWLTEATSKEAIKHGYKNSIYIYNSVRINSTKKANVNKNKNLIFLGRLSKEKRLDIILEIFNKISLIKKDWTLSIYGIGTLSTKEEQAINNNPNIIYYGATNNVSEALLKASISVNTSDFEGFSMTILEANEFGVPTIAFDFGESINEQIINGITGIVVEKGNKEAYYQELYNLMNNEELLDTLSKNCKDYNNNFSYYKIKEKWLNLLNGDNYENY